jgi:hypothetical protein
VAKRSFKDTRMQTTYEDCRRMATDTTSHFYWNGRHARGDGLRSAFWNGYDGQPSRYHRTSLAYAAWAAGQDHEKAGR